MWMGEKAVIQRGVKRQTEEMGVRCELGSDRGVDGEEGERDV